MITPDFLVIGAMKSATSTVCAYLEQHPDVYMVPRCEPNFFSHDENWEKGPEWYAAHFSGRRDEAICGEGSNLYAATALHPKTVARIADFKPDIKLIYIVRDPIRRIISAWIQNRVDSGDQYPPTLDRAVLERPEVYIDQSLYWKTISRYRERFPDDQIFVGFMEDLQREPVAFFQGLIGFLGVEFDPDLRSGHHNKSESKRLPTATYSAVNQLPLIASMKALVPKSLRQLVKDRVLSVSAATKPTFSDPVRASLLETIRPDAEAFLARYGKPRDFWPL